MFVSLPKFLLKISVLQFWIVSILAGMKLPCRVICVLHFGYLTTEIMHPKGLKISQESHASRSRETESKYSHHEVLPLWVSYYLEGSSSGTTLGSTISIYKILRAHKWGGSVGMEYLTVYLWKLNLFTFSFEMHHIQLYSLVFNVS